LAQKIDRRLARRLFFAVMGPMKKTSSETAKPRHQSRGFPFIAGF